MKTLRWQTRHVRSVISRHVPAVQENLQKDAGEYEQRGGSSQARPVERIPPDVARQTEKENARRNDDQGTPMCLQ